MWSPTFTSHTRACFILSFVCYAHMSKADPSCGGQRGPGAPLGTDIQSALAPAISAACANGAPNAAAGSYYLAVNSPLENDPGTGAPTTSNTKPGDCVAQFNNIITACMVSANNYNGNLAVGSVTYTIINNVSPNVPTIPGLVSPAPSPSPPSPSPSADPGSPIIPPGGGGGGSNGGGGSGGGNNPDGGGNNGGGSGGGGGNNPNGGGNNGGGSDGSNDNNSSNNNNNNNNDGNNNDNNNNDSNNNDNNNNNNDDNSSDSSQNNNNNETQDKPNTGDEVQPCKRDIVVSSVTPTLVTHRLGKRVEQTVAGTDPLKSALQNVGSDVLNSANKIVMNRLGDPAYKNTLVVGLAGNYAIPGGQSITISGQKLTGNMPWIIRWDWDPEKQTHVNAEFGKGSNNPTFAYTFSSLEPVADSQDPVKPYYGSKYMQQAVAHMNDLARLDMKESGVQGRPVFQSGTTMDDAMKSLIGHWQNLLDAPCPALGAAIQNSGDPNSPPS